MRVLTLVNMETIVSQPVHNTALGPLKKYNGDVTQSMKTKSLQLISTKPVLRDITSL